VHLLKVEAMPAAPELSAADEGSASEIIAELPLRKE
jgi:hypothetical protein